MRHLGSWAALIFLLNNLGLNLQGIGSHWNIKQEDWHHHFSPTHSREVGDSVFFFFFPSPSIMFNTQPSSHPFMMSRNQSEALVWILTPHQQPPLCDSVHIPLSLSFLGYKMGMIKYPPDRLLLGSSDWQSIRSCLAHSEHLWVLCTELCFSKICTLKS